MSAPGAKAGRRGVLDMAQIIWTGRSVPVALLPGVKGIASSSKQDSQEPPTPDLHSVFAKEITIDAAPTEARLHLFAFTRYRLYVNGVYMGRGPSRYQNQRPEYDSRDLREVLVPGRNVLVVLVHRDAPTGRIMRHSPGLIAALELKDGGRRRLIVTDATWMSMPEMSFGARGQAWSSIEEHVDARKSFDWTRPDLSASPWQPSNVVRAEVSGSGADRFYPRSIPLQTEVERRWVTGTPAFPVEMSAGEEISLRLPEIAQAFHRLEMDAEEGALLEVAYGLPDGETSGRCSYIARSGVQTYIGGDTFAFDRLQLRLRSGRLRLTDAAACEVRYPFERTASFACSDPFFDQLWEICARSLEVMSEDAYVDCADRERVEWTDCSPPAFDCTRVMMRGPDEEGREHWGDARLVRGLLRRIALTQQPDGQLKAHSCSERFDIHAIMEDRTCGWVALLREYAGSTGDTELVRELWPTLRRLLAWYRERRTERGLVLAREWGVWDNPLRYQVCEGAALNAMVYRAMADAAEMAKRVGRVSEAKALGAEAGRLQADFNRLLWNEREGAYDGALFGPGSAVQPQSGHPFAGRVVDGRFRPTAQGNLFAIYSGVVPQSRMAAVQRWVLAHMDEVLEPMSHFYLFRMMYAMTDEVRDREVLARMKAGWRNQVESPWQTTWEDLETGGGSKVHVYGMHPGYFLTAYVLGARREGPVEERRLVIEPRLSGLEWAKGVCVTEFGPVEMDWRRKGPGDLRIVCTVPEKVQAKVRLRSRELGEVLEIDGHRVSPLKVEGWTEAALQAGKHTIQAHRG